MYISQRNGPCLPAFASIILLAQRLGVSYGSHGLDHQIDSGPGMFPLPPSGTAH